MKTTLFSILALSLLTYGVAVDSIIAAQTLSAAPFQIVVTKTVTATATTITTKTATATTTITITVQPTTNTTVAPKPTTTTTAQPTTTVTFVPPKLKNPPVPGKFYMLRSKYGRFIDMRQDPRDDPLPVQSLTDSYMRRSGNKNSLLVQFIDNGDGYYWIKSKYGRYLNLRPDNSTIFDAWSITENYKNKNLVAKDSFLVQLIDNGDGYFWIKSKSGRSLDMKQVSGDIAIAQSLREDFKNQNLGSKDSYVFQLMPDAYLPVSGQFYNVRSKAGYYLNMREMNTPIGLRVGAGLSTTVNSFTKDCFRIQFLDNGDGYYWVRSQLGNYLDMNKDPNPASIMVSEVNETQKNINIGLRDSYLVQFIDNGDGYFWIKSKSGRYLNTAQGEIVTSWSEGYMNQNSQLKNNALVQFIPL